MERIKGWLRGAAEEEEEIASGAEPVEIGERETSTNAQTAGASDEPWPGKD